MAIAAESAPAVRAYLIGDSGEFIDAWILEANSRRIVYRLSGAGSDTQTQEVERSDLSSIYFFEQPEMKDALALYQAGRYADALKRFKHIEKQYAAITEVSENPSTLAGFYQLECLRNLGDLEALAEALQRFRNRGLVRESHLRQLELYVLWDVIRTGQWEKVEALAAPRMGEDLPLHQLAQIAYCRAFALEKLGREHEAIEAYQTVVVAGDAATDPLVRKSILRMLEIYARDPAIVKAMKQGEPGAAANRLIQRRMSEAAALVKIFETLPGDIQPLPGTLRRFLDHVTSKRTWEGHE